MKIYKITTLEFDGTWSEVKIASYHWFPIKKTALKFQRHFNSLFKKLEKAELTFRDSSHSYYGHGRSRKSLWRDFKFIHGCHPASEAMFEVVEITNTRTDICKLLNKPAK